MIVFFNKNLHCHKKLTISDVNSLFDQIEKTRIAQEQDRILARKTHMMNQKTAQIEEEKQEIILKLQNATNNKNPEKKISLLLTKSVQPETIEWIKTFNENTFKYLDVYRVCPRCNFAVLLQSVEELTKNKNHDEECARIMQSRCRHGVFNRITCGNCLSESMYDN